MRAQHVGRRNEGVGLARLDPLTAHKGGGPDKTGPAEPRAQLGAWRVGGSGSAKNGPTRRPSGGGLDTIGGRRG